MFYRWWTFLYSPAPEHQDRLTVAHALDQACKDVGFLYLTGKQFNPELFQKLYHTAQQYFAQDTAIKMQNYIGLSENHSGYVPIGEERFVETSYDLKEAMMSTMITRAKQIVAPWLAQHSGLMTRYLSSKSLPIISISKRLGMKFSKVLH